MNGLRLGRIFGFTVRVDLSWFIVFVLILCSFALAVFPMTAPGLTERTYFVMATALAIIFFGSLVLHEVSHALIARTKRIPVEGITLFIFGSIAQTRAEPERPDDEFTIAGAGPIASLLIALAFVGLHAAAAVLGIGVHARSVLRYAAVLNVAIAGVNLLPGFPLDGGRLLRAALWRATGDLTRATRITTTAGSAFGALLIAAGIYYAVAQGVVGGLWLIFVGWFLHNAAVTSYREHMIALVLKRGRAEEVMQGAGESAGGEWPRGGARDTMTDRATAWTVQPNDTLLRVISGLRASPDGRVLVTRGHRILGSITLRDVTAWLERVQAEER